MVDPISIVAALQAAADTAETLGLLRALIGGDELDRLLDHLDSTFGETTGLSAAQLESWKQDKEFCAALLAVSYTADWESHRGDLLAAVLGLTAADPGTPREDELALAERVVDEIEFFLPYAKQGDEVTRYVGRQTQLTVERSAAPLPELDWTPERGSDLFAELAESDAKEAAVLQRALKGKDLSREIPGLLAAPPSWLAEGSGAMWEVLAASAEGVGLWAEAVMAWEKAFDLPGSDRVRTRVRLATAAYIAGERDRAEPAIAEAQALDPSHPLVLFTRAERSDDPSEALELLDQIEPQKDTHRALRTLRRAMPLAELGRVEEAQAAIIQAEAEEVADTELREIKAQVVVISQRPAWKAGEKTDTEGLIRAAETFLEMRDRHRRLGAHEGSVAFLTSAVGALLMADERRRALALMAVEELTEGELASELNRKLLGEQLMQAGRPDLAAKMLPDPVEEDEDSALLHAILIAQSESPGDALEQAVALLDSALTGDKQLPAAQGRVIASLRHEIDWSEEAVAVIQRTDPGLAAVMRAQWLAHHKRWEEAEEALLPYFAEPRAQHGLLSIAEEREDPERIANRAREILGQPSDNVVRLEAARALVAIERSTEAEAELRKLVGAADAPYDVRAGAFAELAELLTSEERYEDLLAVTDDWLLFSPGHRNATWGRIHCLFRLGRFTEAFEFLETSGMSPETLGQAQLAARIYGLALGGAEAVRRIVEVADELESADEAIEALALFALLDATEEIPADLVERVNPTRFLDEFPDSTLIQRFDAPESAEELVALLEEMGGNRADRIAKAADSVFEQAIAPVGLIGVVAGHTVAETWRKLQARPIGFSLAELLEDERAFASDALVLGAVWDPSSLYLVEAIGGRLPEVLRRFLPKSVICQSTLDDALADSAGLRNQTERSTIGLDEEGRAFLTEWTEQELAEEAVLIDRVQTLTRELSVEPDLVANDAGPAARSIKDFDDPKPQLLTFLGTLAVAERLELPVFSADRFVRLTARRSGIRTFGLEALIDALADRGEIASEERHAFRRRMRELNAIGMRVNAEELAADSCEANFRLTKSVAHALQDPVPIAAGMGDWHLTLLDFLRMVHEEAPESLDIWTARVISALESNLSLSPSQLGGRLLALSFRLGNDENRFTSGLATSTISAVSYLRDRNDPVLAAARLLYQATAGGLDWFTRGVLVARFANLMPPGHSFRARLVIFEDDGN